MDEPNMVTVGEVVDACTPDGKPVSVPPGRYKIVPFENSVREGLQTILLEAANGSRLPELVTRTPEGRTPLGNALSVERAPAWDEKTYGVACVYLDAWR